MGLLLRLATAFVREIFEFIDSASGFVFGYVFNFGVRRYCVKIQMGSATKHAGNYVIDGGPAITTEQLKSTELGYRMLSRIYYKCRDICEISEILSRLKRKITQQMQNLWANYVERRLRANGAGISSGLGFRLGLELGLGLGLNGCALLWRMSQPEVRVGSALSAGSNYKDGVQVSEVSLISLLGSRDLSK